MQAQMPQQWQFQQIQSMQQVQMQQFQQSRQNQIKTERVLRKFIKTAHLKKEKEISGG